MSPRLAGSPEPSRRPVEEPTVGEHGYEHHPAWGLLGASRVASTPGSVLFDSDIRHGHSVIIRLSTAGRKRDLHSDRLHAVRRVFELEMSEAQWASFVSTMNSGDGVPCTIRETPGVRDVPAVPFEPRLQESMAEVRTKADDVVATIQAAFDAYAEKKTVANLRSLQAAINNAAPNVEFAAKSLSEHAENVVQRARADIEAMAIQQAELRGLEPGDIGVAALTAGDEEEERS
jgi:hypothetical protein